LIFRGLFCYWCWYGSRRSC